uniref:Uncharacterized protein n=1 Tax=Zonotrichia albicollis TaxID=44394 RepID=A0A8D2MZC5_ZONAL
MSDFEEYKEVNVREEIEEFFPRMWKINQDKRRLMKRVSLPVKISSWESCSCKIREQVRISQSIEGFQTL